MKVASSVDSTSDVAAVLALAPTAPLASLALAALRTLFAAAGLIALFWSTTDPSDAAGPTSVDDTAGITLRIAIPAIVKGSIACTTKCSRDAWWTCCCCNVGFA